ncbi:MAG: hypothetical protein H6740_11615 [Alphaproteobacteria bacterium]|nr:hypothetical protein [Alphaproteobacteria bacterium]
MSPFDLVLWGIVAILALGAAWLTLPSAPDMDWERLLKLGILTQLRGEVEAAEGDADAWLAAGRAAVCYHPAARDLAAKLDAPEAYEPPVPALPGERALVEALRAAPELSRRIQLVFGPEAEGDLELYDDPALFGEDWDLARILGPGASWEAVAAWSPELQEVLGRRAEHLSWVIVAEEDEGVLALTRGLAEAVGEARVLRLAPDSPEAILEALTERLGALSDRVVLIGEGEGAAALARALAEAPGVRDRVRAVLAIGGHLGGDTAAWLAEHFTHEGMDTEISRAVPWFHLAFLDPEVRPAGAPGLPLAETAWPTPEPPENGRLAIEVIDLGVLPGGLERARPRLLGRAIGLLITVRLALE